MNRITLKLKPRSPASVELDNKLILSQWRHITNKEWLLKEKERLEQKGVRRVSIAEKGGYAWLEIGRRRAGRE